MWRIHANTSHFGMCDIYVRPILRFLYVRILHKCRILDVWKNRTYLSHLWMKNSCEFFTRVTDSLEFESRTNLSHVWKFEHICYTCANSLHVWIIRTNSSHVWQIRTRDVWQIHHKRVFVMHSYLSEVRRFLWNLECRYLTLAHALHLLTCIFVKT